MPDIVDAFVVSLGIDATEYEKEIKKFRADRKDLAEENDKYNRDERDGQKKTVEGIRKIRNETAGFLLMLAGASSVAGFAKDLLTADANTGRFARNIGMATERVSVWENAIKQVGGTSQEAQQGLKTLYDIFQNREYGLDNSKDFILARFGLTARDLKNPEEALLRISDRLKSMPRANAQKELELLGLSDSFVGLLSGDRGDLRKMLDSIEKAGVATDESAEAAMTLEQEMAKTETSLKDAFRPAVELAAVWLGKLAELVRDDVVPIFKTMVGWLSPLFGKSDPTPSSGGGSSWGIPGLFEFKTSGGGSKPSQRPAAAGGTPGWFGMSPLGMLSDLQSAGSYDQYVVALESGGRANARADTSSATGLHQFTSGTWLQTVAKANPAWARGRSRSQILAMRTDSAKSAEMEAVLRADSAAALRRAGFGASNENLYAMHHFGAGGGLKFARASNDTDISDILTGAQIAANPYLRGKTKGQVMAEWGRRAGRSMGMASATGRNLRTPAAANRATRNVSTSRTTTIGAVNVYTQATQADQITRDMAAALMKRDLVVQGGTGLKP